MTIYAANCFVDVTGGVGAPSKTHQNDNEMKLDIPNAVAPAKTFSEGGSTLYDSSCEQE